MSVRSLCLAILNFSDATGYEIRKETTSGSFSYFGDASFGAIYPALSRLEAEGRVTVREESQHGKPTRKVYSITEAGRLELVEALLEPPAHDTFKSPFLLLALHAELVGPRVLEKAIETRRKHLQDELDLLRSIPQDAEPGASNWVRDYGIQCKTFALGYLDANAAELIELAGRKHALSPRQRRDALFSNAAE
ncbi:PadR family transcriptional regulator [Roseibium litorale]|uniref:PadR family transcriptional regulator n=1 Tax=Roseibium litorale TaxID=2803841 RepID=A0ABR9CQ42_9HYPH|nr:PadR family transcriptional regulator [Roseibium litorale]MBD8892783.1 PadR family transcriptional regulator [Roseibium litorale]